jgi:predicted alpha/beta-hydrolase family hydrolase
MNALILGGENPRHYEWVRRVAVELQPHFKHAEYLDYRHWSTGEPTDVAHELEAAERLAARLGDYVIVAKSIGTVIAILGISGEKLKPVRCVFMGLPLGAAERFIRDKSAFANVPPTMFVQNEHDPLGSGAEAAAYLKALPIKQYDLIVIPGDTHDYADFALIARLAAGQKS